MDPVNHRNTTPQQQGIALNIAGAVAHLTAAQAASYILKESNEDPKVITLALLYLKNMVEPDATDDSGDSLKFPSRRPEPLDNPKPGPEREPPKIS